MNIKIRKAKPGDEIGINEMVKYGLKTKNVLFGSGTPNSASGGS